MESVKDYLERLEINNNILIKQFADVNISKVTYFKEEKIIYIYLNSKNIISYDHINLFRKELKQHLEYFSDGHNFVSIYTIFVQYFFIKD